MNKNVYIKAMQIVKQKIDKIPTTTSTNIDTLSVSSPVTFSVLSKKDTAKQLMNRLAGIDTNQPNVRLMSADVEVSLFSNAIRTKQSFKEFWSTNCHAYPRLVTLVHRYFIAPATSVASESAFSISEFIARKQRSSLLSRTLRQLLALKYRKNLLRFQFKKQLPLFQNTQFQSLSLDAAGSSSV